MGNEKTLRVGTGLTDFTSQIRPEKIVSIEEYTLINALFSPLVLVDNHGQLESNLATRFYWKDETTLVFLFERKQATVDGFEIGADDALLSLKRLILLNKNSHGILADRIEIPPSFQSIHDPLNSLYVEDGKLIIVTKQKDPFILSILTSADFAIIPKRSLDPESLQIKDFRNTSGPYYLKQEDEKSATLEANPKHFRLTNTTAQFIVFHKFGKNPQFYKNAFSSGEIDHIPTDSVLSKSDYYELSKKPSVILHEARNVLLAYGSFSPKARLKFSAEQRLAISQVIQQTIQVNIKKLSPHADPTVQFFLAEGAGGLKDSELRSRISDILSRASPKTLDLKNIRLSIEAFPNMIKLIKPIFQGVFAELTFIPMRTGIKFRDSDSDILLSSTDVGLKNDYTGLSFTIEKGIFPFSEDEGRKWLHDMSFQINDQERLKTIESLHWRALFQDPTIIPLYRLPIFALAQNGWKMDLPKLWVTQRYWQIHR